MKFNLNFQLSISLQDAVEKDLNKELRVICFPSFCNPIKGRTLDQCPEFPKLSILILKFLVE